MARIVHKPIRVQRTIALTFVLVGCWGAFLIFYGVVSLLTGEYWAPLEKYAPAISSGLTVIGTALTATSVYLPHEAHKPYAVSRQVVAPVVIVSSMAAFSILLLQGSLPTVVVTGFSLLAISGGLLRIFDINPQEISN